MGFCRIGAARLNMPPQPREHRREPVTLIAFKVAQDRLSTRRWALEGQRQDVGQRRRSAPSLRVGSCG
jgi:hypothetical protein